MIKLTHLKNILFFWKWKITTTNEKKNLDLTKPIRLKETKWQRPIPATYWGKDEKNNHVIKVSEIYQWYAGSLFMTPDDPLKLNDLTIGSLVENDPNAATPTHQQNIQYFMLGAAFGLFILIFGLCLSNMY